MSPKNQWKIRVTRQPDKFLTNTKIPREIRLRLYEAIVSLEDNPRPASCKKLRHSDYDNLYRIRVGDWRVSYAIYGDELVILVVEIASQQDAYQYL